MRAVWSFWSKPFAATRRHTWLSEKHHLLSWALSLATASEHYRPTILYTDDDGARLLIDEAGLQFDQVVLSLNDLGNHDQGWWPLGKLYAYRSQDEPFVHVDSDVYLWRPLPQQLVRAPVFAQSPEIIWPGASYYEPETLEAVLSASHGGWLPPEWCWYRESGLPQRGENCGILGGRNIEFIRHYASQAIAAVEHRGNLNAWSQLDRKATHSVLIEQYLLAACIEYHRGRADSPFRSVNVAYLFASMEEAFNSDQAVRRGYTHLIASAKTDPDIAELLEKRVAHDWPELHERSCRAAARRPTLHAT